MLPSHVFSHILFVKKLCTVILHLLGHTGSITFLWTPFFYMLKPFTLLLGDTEGVKECQSLPCLGLGMWKVTSLLCVDKRWLKHAGNTQLCVIKLLLSQISRPPTFELWIWCQKLGLYASIYGILKVLYGFQSICKQKCKHLVRCKWYN